MVSIACTIFFEDPFWVGVWERTDGSKFCVAKTPFGARPSEAEVWAFILTRYQELAFFETESGCGRLKNIGNPKRMQREAARAVSAEGVGTNAQQALKAQYEAGKLAHKTKSREQKREEETKAFLLRREKKKARHRGH